MPLYDYRCSEGHVTEVLLAYTERASERRCICGRASSILVSMPARTSYGWGDTKWDGFHDRALNVTFRDKAHRDREMQKRGLRELAPGEVEAEQSRVTSEHDKHEAQMATFQSTMAETGGDSALAMERTFPNPEV